MIEMFLTCLALNVYHEARSEPMDGQYAVAHVVLNRVADDSFPDDACKVVKQGYHRASIDVSFRGTVTVSQHTQRQYVLDNCTSGGLQHTVWSSQRQYMVLRTTMLPRKSVVAQAL